MQKTVYRACGLDALSEKRGEIFTFLFIHNIFIQDYRRVSHIRVFLVDGDNME